MTGSLDNLVVEALRLPPDQRLTLAHRILSSVEAKPDADLDAVWDAEIRERIARFDAGETRTISASVVFAEAQRRLNQ